MNRVDAVELAPTLDVVVQIVRGMNASGLARLVTADEPGHEQKEDGMQPIGRLPCRWPSFHQPVDAEHKEKDENRDCDQFEEAVAGVLGMGESRCLQEVSIVSDTTSSTASGSTRRRT